MRQSWLCSCLLVLALGCSSGRGAVPPSGGSSTQTPVANTTIAMAPDSLYTIVHQRLVARGYRIDRTDERARRLVVRAPGDPTAVEVRITPKGDGSVVDVVPLDGADLVASMRALITVTHDATRDPTEGEPRSR